MRCQLGSWVSVVVFQTASQGSELSVTGGVHAEGGQLPFKDAAEGIPGRWSRWFRGAFHPLEARN